PAPSAKNPRAVHNIFGNSKDSSCLVLPLVYLRLTAGFELAENAVDLIFFFELGKAVIQTIAFGHEFSLGLANGFGAHHFLFHAVKSGYGRVVPDFGMGIGGLGERAGAAVLGHQQFTFGVGLIELLL